jgi:predicted RNA-binding Zn ribbon-like protein
MTEFEFSGGTLCLDFVNTKENRSTAAPIEKLESYDDLARWGSGAGLVGRDTRVRAHPAAATAALRDARNLREALFVVILTPNDPPAEELSTVNRFLSLAMGKSALVRRKTGLAWEWPADPTDLRGPILWPVVRSAADLLSSPDRELVRQCAADTCDWLYLDRQHRRRWCSMDTCGNRAKAARYYSRRKTRT